MCCGTQIGRPDQHLMPTTATSNCRCRHPYWRTAQAHIHRQRENEARRGISREVEHKKPKKGNRGVVVGESRDTVRHRNTTGWEGEPVKRVSVTQRERKQYNSSHRKHRTGMTRKHTNTRTHTHVHTYMCRQGRVCADPAARENSGARCVHASIHALTRTDAHVHTHTHAQVHTHAETQKPAHNTEGRGGSNTKKRR